MSRVQSLQVNGALRAIDAEPQRLLLGVLRDDLGLTGAKYGCGEAQCGACVVLVGGKPVPACITTLGEVENQPISTIEGLACGERLHPVQEAFIAAGAMQCGYCTPGMIMEVVAILRDNPRADDATIIAAMDRHICRCGVYSLIMDAIRDARAKMQKGTA
ncbi:MAG TPA: (2Fe-2S)-binding protein [Abditibacterium sp.]|jgi:aerobic-type carbon monoxide dehydrogenase small subunit (CoxS/CutS family)